MALRVVREDIVWQEVPGEVSLAYTVAGCPLRCKGCHSADTWNPEQGTELTPEILCRRLQDYAGMVSCVLFFGGEWQENDLAECLDAVMRLGLKTCLYTGLEDVSGRLKALLTYLKTGPWRRECGGLENPATNQRFVRTADNCDLTPMFWRS